MKKWLLLAAALLGLPTQAVAQAYQCRMPQSVSVPQVRADGPTRTVPVTGYTLALSWSPEFCKGRETDARQRTQCSGRNGRFGLIVHGFWPDGRSTWPQWCPTQRLVSQAEARKNMCMTHSARLIARQENLTAGDIRRAFSDANGRHWEPEMVGVKLNSRGWLEELRLCYGEDFMPNKCDRGRFGAGDNAPARIWRGL